MPNISRRKFVYGAAAAILLPSRPSAAQDDWREAFVADHKRDWRAEWFLFGDPSRGITVSNSAAGLTLRAGDGSDPRRDHAVLWSKRTFTGDVRIEYDVTVLDGYASPPPKISYCSALLVHAQGATNYPSDLAAWTAAQANADTSGNFVNTNTRGLQLNYAFVGDVRGNRLRLRVNPGYALAGQSDITTLFRQGQTCHVSATKAGALLTVHVTDGKATFSHTFTDAGLAAHGSGRIGLRNMNRREARYANLRVYERRQNHARSLSVDRRSAH
jgi:hypothetical protein